MKRSCRYTIQRIRPALDPKPGHTAKTPAVSFVSINLTKLNWSNSPPRKPLMTNLNRYSTMPRPYKGNLNFLTRSLSCVAAIWDFQPQKPMISKSGCRLRGFTAKFHPAAILKIFRHAAPTSGLRKKAKKVLSWSIPLTDPDLRWVDVWLPFLKIFNRPMAALLSHQRCDRIWAEWKK